MLNALLIISRYKQLSSKKSSWNNQHLRSLKNGMRKWNSYVSKPLSKQTWRC